MIEIPDPVFRVESKRVDAGDAWTYQVAIVVGQSEVFARQYHDDYEMYDSPTYADDQDDAERKTVEAFGERLKELLCGS